MGLVAVGSPVAALNQRQIRILILVACLLVGAAALRMPGLGSMGFYGNEETHGYLAQYLSQAQLEWRSGVISDENLMFVGRDKRTRVFRISCQSVGS